MTITVRATFEEGTFKLAQAIELPEGTPVRLSITPEQSGSEVLSDEDEDDLIARGRELVRRARERNFGVSMDVIDREIEQAIQTVRGRQG